MTAPVRIVVAGRPAPKGSWIPVGTHGAMRPDNPRSVPWADALAGAAKVAMIGRAPFVKVPLVLSAVFYLPPDNSQWSMPIGAKTGDLDKIVRNCGDALKRIVWDDDSRVVMFGGVTKLYATHTPGAVIEVREWAASDAPTVMLKEVG